MTVKELIDLLSTFNPDYEVYGPCPDGFGWIEADMEASLFQQDTEDKTMYISSHSSHL